MSTAGSTVVVVGAAGALGRRVVARIAADPAVARVVAVDRHRWGGPDGPTSAAVERIVDEAAGGEPKRWVEGADAVVYLAPTTRDAPGADGTGSTSSSPADVEALLAACEDAPVRTLVVLSSATVYGADPANPVPLTESAPLSPDPGVALATTRATVEELATAWAREDERRTAALLRTVVAVGPELARWFAASPWAAVGTGREDGPPLQLVHLDDLASAVDVARRRRLDGPANVAPDDWLDPEEVAALAGPAGRLRGARRRFERLGLRSRRPGLAGTAYEDHPWVVANDRLRSLGWAPATSTAEAFVEVDEPGPLGELSARRRQQLAFGAVGLLAAVAATAATAVLRRRRR